MVHIPRRGQRTIPSSRGFLLLAVLVLAVTGILWFSREQGRPAVSESERPGTTPPHDATAVTPAAKPASFLPPPPSAHADSRSADRIQRLEQENRRLAAEVDQLGNWVLANVRGTYPLPGDMVSYLKLPALDTNLAVHADLARLLRMNERESAMVNDALGFARSRMTRVETQMVSVTSMEENKIALYVPPYETEGLRVKEDLYGAIEGSLGGARFDQFLRSAGTTLDESFHYFGTAARTLEVELIPPQGTETAYLLIRDGWQIPDGESVTHWNGRETATRELPAEYAAFRSLLPPAIAVYAR